MLAILRRSTKSTNGGIIHERADPETQPHDLLSGGTTREREMNVNEPTGHGPLILDAVRELVAKVPSGQAL